MIPTDAERAVARDLVSFIDRSPTPFHAVAECTARLGAAGFRELDESDEWELGAGDRAWVSRNGTSMVAFVVGHEAVARSGFRMVGAHTDSPNLRVKPAADLAGEGLRQLGVEVYGGALLHTWLDRDLSLAGRVARRDGRSVLVDLARPLLRIPSLAIHLDRNVNTSGLVLNPQRHMAPVLGIDDSDASAPLAELLGRALPELTAKDILGFDLCLYDAQPGAIAGAHSELLYSGRLDNLASCHAAVGALAASGDSGPATRLVVLYDHEEVGSRTAQGAASPFLRSVLSRIAHARSSGAQGLDRALARSSFVSADMAHAVHPNYADLHEGQHRPRLGKGPVIKSSSNQSYATDGESAASFAALCEIAGFEAQRFVNRSDLPCGSTVGPITAAELGVKTVDVGNPMLSMHSAREMAAVADCKKMLDVLTLFFSRR
ncbi:MAG: M18 family aminopeptidase [Deltaproteobacteria bacterium]|nr:M18 family aminopeptidase [Deltaproteobacteria bacterium]